MKYQAIITGIAGKVETISRDSAGNLLDVMGVRDVLNDAKQNPFLQSAFIQSISETGQPVTLERFTRH